jgi:hypothetical protein
VNLSALSALFRDWPNAIGPITHSALHHLPGLLYALLRLRVSNDHSLRHDRHRYSLYTSASIFIAMTIVVELAELMRREREGTGLDQLYLRVRSFERQSIVDLPLGSAAPLDLLEADPLAYASVTQAASARSLDDSSDFIAERLVELKQQAARDRKARAIESIKLSSLLCIPRLICCINALTGRFALWADFDEGRGEQRLKFDKAGHNASNGRDHLSVYGPLADNQQFAAQKASLQHSSDRWEGDSLSEICIAECYLRQNRVAALNLIGALRVGVEVEVGHHITLVKLADCSFAVALAVGLQRMGNQRVVLCCCGLRTHFDALSSLDNPRHVVATGYDVLQWAQTTFPQDAVLTAHDESEKVMAGVWSSMAF